MLQLQLIEGLYRQCLVAVGAEAAGIGPVTELITTIALVTVTMALDIVTMALDIVTTASTTTTTTIMAFTDTGHCFDLGCLVLVEGVVVDTSEWEQVLLWVQLLPWPAVSDCG